MLGIEAQRKEPWQTLFMRSPAPAIGVRRPPSRPGPIGMPCRLGWRCLLLARQIGPLRVTRQECGGREKHHGVTGWLDQSRPKQRFEVGRILAADANAASHKSNPQAQAAPPRAIVKARRATREAIAREKLAPTVDRGRLDVIVFESGAESRIAVLAVPPGC